MSPRSSPSVSFCPDSSGILETQNMKIIANIFKIHMGHQKSIENMSRDQPALFDSCDLLYKIKESLRMFQ